MCWIYINISSNFLLQCFSVKEEKKDGFVEKLATQIIKNLQIHVRNIHVRYEDKVGLLILKFPHKCIFK